LRAVNLPPSVETDARYGQEERQRCAVNLRYSNFQKCLHIYLGTVPKTGRQHQSLPVDATKTSRFYHNFQRNTNCLSHCLLVSDTVFHIDMIDTEIVESIAVSSGSVGDYGVRYKPTRCKAVLSLSEEFISSQTTHQLPSSHLLS